MRKSDHATSIRRKSGCEENWEAIKRDYTEYMANAIPGARLIILKDASHFSSLRHPDGYTKAAPDFIDAK